MSDVPASWLKSALFVTGHFEDSADPFGGVAGDSDGMGISLGVLQWNIGQGSLQPLIVKLGRERTLAAAPQYGAELWTACTSDIPAGLAIVRGWQSGKKLPKPAVADLKALAHSPAFVEIQMASSEGVAEEAMRDAQAWAASATPAGAPDKASFCWFFDVRTQNGGLKGLTRADVQNFIAMHGALSVDDVICDWLAARDGRDAGYRDSRRNATLWRNAVPAARLPLFVLSYLRALKARKEYRGDVLNRKGAIALGKGWVHLGMHDVEAELSSP